MLTWLCCARALDAKLRSATCINSPCAGVLLQYGAFRAAGRSLTAVNVQKKMGGVPQAMVSSELAAMFDLRVWPKLLECYLLPADEFSEAQIRANYDQQCKDFAAKIGRPWTEVHYPFFISMDNCKKHPWLRKLMLEPRLSEGTRSLVDAGVAACVQQQQQQQRNNVIQRRAFIIALEIAARRGWIASTDYVLGQSLAEARAARGDYDDEISQWHAEFKRKHGCTYEQSCWRLLAWKHAFIRTISPEQFMPLVECTPDIHAPVEHMVGTLKRNVRKLMWSVPADLWVGKTYQMYLNNLVQTRGNGAAGRKHIAGSVRKQPLTCEILAAETDEIVELHYVFGGVRLPGKKDKRTRVWRVKGTAGGYIRQSKWT